MSNDRTLDEVETLIAEFQRSGLRELHVRGGGVEIFLSNDPAAQGLDGRAPAAPAPQRSAAAAPAAVATRREEVLPPEGFLVRAPYRGTFYRAPKPGAKPYVEVGDVVAPETDLCLVEVMKLFTAVRSPQGGKVHSVVARDGELVESGQSLFVLVPA